VPTATYIALATFTATGTETSVTFSSIPSTYRDLVIQGSVKGDEANGVFLMELNGDASNRTGVRMYGTGSSAASDSPNDGIVSATIGTNFGTLKVDIMDYSATDKHKTSLIRSNDAGTLTIAGASRWASTSAVTSVKILSNRTYQAGMTLTLYGIVS